MAGKIGFDEEEKLIQAMHVFWKNGYAGTSMHELVEAMGVNRSSLYNTFGDKEELFLKCLRYYSDIMYCNYELAAKKSNSAKQSIYTLIDEGANLAVSNGASCLATKVCFEVPFSDEKTFYLLKRDEERVIGLLCQLIEEARKNGEINMQYDSTILANYIFSHFPGWRRSFLINHDATLIRQMATMLKNQIHE